MVVARCSRYNTGDWSRQMADEDEIFDNLEWHRLWAFPGRCSKNVTVSFIQISKTGV